MRFIGNNTLLWSGFLSKSERQVSLDLDNRLKSAPVFLSQIRQARGVHFGIWGFSLFLGPGGYMFSEAWCCPGRVFPRVAASPCEASMAVG